MKIGVLGSGGREHAIAWKILQSPMCSEVVVVPGNDGMTITQGIRTVSIDPSDFDALENLFKTEQLDLIVVGPEVLLDKGIVDRFESKIPILGPSAAAAQMESSKAFAKSIMKEANVPTAQYKVCSSKDTLSFIEQHPFPQTLVLKADGLAAGKGVFLCTTKKEALEAHQYLFSKLNINTVLIEEYMEGWEVSAFALCSGTDFVYLGAACDYKRLQDGDLGPNTGGMGAYTPPSQITPKLEHQIQDHIFDPVLKELARRGTPYKGILYAGLMITGPSKDPTAKVVEFNARFGDPETQVLLPSITTDLVPLFLSAAQGSLTPIEIEHKNGHFVEVVIASEGYPGLGEIVQKGRIIQLPTDPKSLLFSAALQMKDEKWTANGGRVLGLTAQGLTLSEAREAVYSDVSNVSLKGARYRTDIGAMDNEKSNVE
ncbi:MAG: phosphoribosylamine--glycine ligase [Proteobacteria bacterium]|nr:phosphoribosylamine--glycine ligase [Pseudomonadota bacterium]